MATRATKPKVAQPEPEDPRVIDMRPGEVVVVSSERTLVYDPAMDRGYSTKHSYGIEEGVPTLLPYRCLLNKDHDGFEQERRGVITIRTDLKRGVMPEIVESSDSRARRTWIDGKEPGPNRAQRIDHVQGIVIDRSLAEVIVNALDAGVPEDKAFGVLCGVYDRAFITQTAFSRPWIEASQRLIAEATDGEA